MMFGTRSSREASQNLKSQLKSKGRARRETLAIGASRPFASNRRNDLLPKLSLVELPIANLRPPSRRIRKSSEAHVREVADSISALGFCAPVLIGKDDEVLDGWIRVEAAQTLGLDQMPCILIDHLSKAEQRLLRLAVNRLAEKGEWDLDALKVEFEELIIEEAPIEITGFELPEIDHILLDDCAKAAEPGPMEPVAGAVAVSRQGDVYELGPHRLMCGDATSPADLSSLMGESPAARMVLTDEPYNVPIAGHVSGGPHREFVMASGEMSEAEFLTFNLAWMGAALEHLCDGGVMATFIDWRGFPTVYAAASKLGLLPLNLVVWGKTNAGMGSLYRSQHELLPLYKKGRAPHLNNVELGRRGRWRSNLWTYPGASSLGSDARKGLREHPTVKPTAMLEDALLDLTRRGDVVLDPFLGSGSTLLAAHKTGRACRGMELDPLFVDVAIRRLEVATELGARLIETGESFKEVASRRATELKDQAA